MIIIIIIIITAPLAPLFRTLVIIRVLYIPLLCCAVALLSAVGSRFGHGPVPLLLPTAAGLGAPRGRCARRPRCGKDVWAVLGWRGKSETVEVLPTIDIYAERSRKKMF